jgi:hypothetical protein
MLQRGRGRELLPVLKTDGSWVRVGSYPPALCEDCTLDEG